MLACLLESYSHWDELLHYLQGVLGTDGQDLILEVAQLAAP